MAEAQSISIGAKLKEAGRHTIIYGMGTVVQSASGLILLPILTGALTKEDFGAYSLILMASSIASAVFYFGMTSALPRSYFDYESIDDRRAVFTTAFIVLLAGALLQSGFGRLFGAEISNLLTGGSQYADAVCFALMGGAVGFVNAYFFAYLRLLRKSIASVLLSIISLVGTIGLTLHLLSLHPGNVVVPFEAMAYAQATIAIYFVFIYGRSAFILRIMRKELPNLLHFGVTSIVASFGSLLIESLDRLMIQHFMGLAEVGTFSAAMRVSMLINVILILPFTQIWSPMMLEYRTKANISELFTVVFSVFMMSGGVVVIVASLFATEFLPVLIRSGLNSAVVFVFLTCILGLLIFGATNLLSAGLFYERKVHLLPFAYYGVALVKFCGNLLLIPLWGVAGATLSAFLSYLALPIAVYAISKKYFSFRIEWARLGAFIAIMAPSLLYGYYSAFYPPENIYLRLAGLVITLLLVYKLCLSAPERHSIAALLKQRTPKSDLALPKP